MPSVLPEVTVLYDRRGERPPNAVGAGEFWYEPEVWTLPGLSPAARVLYTGLCSFLGPGEINRHDLRNTLKASTDGEINEAFEELIRLGLLEPSSRGFNVYPVKGADPSGESATP
ncbi:hypothetical protein BH24ACT21_BH24ACT21_05030 [soil metagenome]|jgi:hypothetical protein